MALGPEAKRKHRLLKEIEQLRSKLAALERDLEQQATEQFQERLEHETRRSQRQNHFLGLLVVRSERTAPRDVRHRIKPWLRCTDFVEVIRVAGAFGGEPGGGREGATVSRTGTAGEAEEVAAMLPETDRAGAEEAVARLKEYLPNMGDVKLGLAVYPDDSTDARDLLAFAEAAAA